MKYYLIVAMTLLLLSTSTLMSNIPLAKSDSQVLFSDDFNDGNANGWTSYCEAEGSWSVIGGEYCVTVGYVENGISTVNGLNLTDCVIEVKLRFGDAEVGYIAGIVFRYLDNEHYYSFEISNEYDSMVLRKYTSENPGYGDNINWTVPGASPIQSNTDYLLKVVIQGNRYTCFFNNQEMFNGVDSEYTQGEVGLRARRANAFFDDFKVSSVENHDVAITNITPSQTVIGQGMSSSINVTVTNQGNYTETFNVKLYARNTSEPVISQNGLVGYWKLDEGNGTIAYDSSPHTNHGTLVNGPLWVDGKYGKALNLDGIDDYVLIPDSSSLRVQSFTLEAWIYMTKRPYQHDEHSAIINKLNHLAGASKGYKLQFEHPTSTNDHLVVTLGDSVSQRFILDYNSTNDLTLNTWHHIAGTYDGITGKLYIDGQLEITTHPGSWAIVHDETPLMIGREQNYPYCRFNGVIDDAMVYNRALSDEEIRSQYQEKVLMQNRVVTLSSGNFTTVTLTWNTSDFAKGNYTIEATTDPVEGEIDTADNILIYESVKVGIPGDVNADDYVGIDDLFEIATHFGQEPGHPYWNPNYDIIEDDYIGIDDIFTAAKHFGEEG
jgi:hypothetical protein